MKKFLIIALVLVAAGVWVFSQYWYYLPGIISSSAPRHAGVSTIFSPKLSLFTCKPLIILLILLLDLSTSGFQISGYPA